MSFYQCVWRVVWGAVAVVLIAAAFINWSHGAVLGMFLIPGGVVGLATFLYYREPKRPLATRSYAVRRSLSIGAKTGACTVVIASATSSLLTLAWPLLALCLCTSPVVLRRARDAVRRNSDARRQRRAAAAAEAAWWSMLAREVEGLTDDQLCRRWRASYSALLEAADAASAARVVRARQVYLDELDRRHGQAVSAWLASGPRPTGGPERFLQAQRRRDPA